MTEVGEVSAVASDSPTLRFPCTANVDLEARAVVWGSRGNLDRLGAVSQSRAERGSGSRQAPAHKSRVIGPRPRVAFSGPFGCPRRSL